MLVRIDNDDSTKITLRSSQAEDAELPATQTLLIIALSAFSILLILDVLQLAFLRDSWSEHATTLLFSVGQMLVLVSQLDQVILQYDLSSSNLAAVSWALLGIAALTEPPPQRLLNEPGLPDGWHTSLFCSRSLSSLTRFPHLSPHSSHLQSSH